MNANEIFSGTIYELLRRSREAEKAIHKLLSKERKRVRGGYVEKKWFLNF